MRLLYNARRPLALVAFAAALAACSSSSLDSGSIFGAYILTEYNDDDVPAPQACTAGASVLGGSVVLNPEGTATHTLVLSSSTGAQSELHSTGTYTAEGDEAVLVLRTGNSPTFTLTAEVTNAGLRITRPSACNTTVTEEYAGPYINLQP